MDLTRITTLAASASAGAARVALGILWLNEGLTKYRAHFGRADILLVVNSTATNARVPDFYKFFTAHILGAQPYLFGIAIPVLETGLGVLLVLGVLVRTVATASALTLCTYWLADQLTDQYPIMMALSVVVLLWSTAASTLSVTGFIEYVRRHRDLRGNGRNRKLPKSAQFEFEHGLRSTGWNRRCSALRHG